MLNDIDASWRPSATIEALRRRGAALQAIRGFFADRGVLEVETPLLAPFGTVDLWIDSFTVSSHLLRDPLWLQTSPEFYMKRLLAAGSGPIWQLCKAFRDEGEGSRHVREFTILEWYRPGWSLPELCLEIWELCATLIPSLPKARSVAFAELFQEHCGLDPFLAPIEALREAVHREIAVVPELPLDDRDGWLDLLFVTAIEPKLGMDAPVFVTNYPASRAALARTLPTNPPTAARAELYWKGVELCNAYDELADADELLERFREDAHLRARAGRDVPAIDHGLIDGHRAGIPPTSGVAVGIDRLIMLAEGASAIREVIAFA
jgi:elongation factor P--(R)-beta-lysine ligase